jgi:hypothetical protein
MLCNLLAALLASALAISFIQIPVSANPVGGY